MPKQKKIETNDITLMQFVSQLRPAQLWAVLVVIAGLITGSFSFGYQLSSTTAEAKIAQLEAEAELNNTKLQTEINKLQGGMERFRGLESKERFLSLYLRYLLAKDAWSRDNTPENLNALATARQAFENLINDQWVRTQETAKDVEISGLILGKGGGRESTVKFLYDGSIWPIPSEFQIVELK